MECHGNGDSNKLKNTFLALIYNDVFSNVVDMASHFNLSYKLILLESLPDIQTKAKKKNRIIIL